MEKKSTIVYAVIISIAIFLFAGVSFAATSVADIQAKIAAAKNVGVTTLIDIQKTLKAARAEKELIRVKGIAGRFGTNDLHALKLSKNVNGDTIGEIAKVVSGAGLRNIRKIVEANGLKMKECEKLHPGFVFYIPTSMIAQELRLNAFEIANLQKDVKILKGEVVKLNGQIEKQAATIATLTGNLTAEKVAHKSDLAAEVAAHGETKATLAAKQRTLEIAESNLEKEVVAHGETIANLMAEKEAYAVVNGKFADEVEAHKVTKGNFVDAKGVIATQETTIASQGKKITALEAIKKMFGMKHVLIFIGNAALVIYLLLFLLLFLFFIGRFVYRSFRGKGGKSDTQTKGSESADQTVASVVSNDTAPAI